jgi:dTDP-4-dehydrorhamnose reductase
MVGGGALDKKFVGKIARMMLDGKNSLRVVNDKWGSPTFAKDLLQGIHRLLSTGYYGLYHLANPGSGSRYDVAQVVRDALQRPDISITPISSDEFPLPAPRARSEVLRNLKLELLGLHRMRPWQEALVEYVQTELVPAGSVRGTTMSLSP